jgi:hypothetical protein
MEIVALRDEEHCFEMDIMRGVRSVEFFWAILNYIFKGFVRGCSCIVLLTFSQPYIEHDLRKNKIVVSFFCQPINFYELIVRF